MTTGRVICVLGPGRSGTSLTAAVLEALGVYLGAEKELTPAGKGNEKGYREHRRIMLLNERLLRAHGGGDGGIPRLPPGWECSADLEPERAEARAAIAESFGGHRLWGWKDPKCSLTIPFWQQLVPNMRYVVCVRNPLDVVASAQRRIKIDRERAFFSWLRQMARALVNTSGQPRILLFYNRYFEDLDRTVAELEGLTGCTRRSTDEWRKIQGIVDDSLRHHQSSLEELLNDANAPADVKALYAALAIAAAASGEDGSGTHPTVDAYARHVLAERDA